MKVYAPSRLSVASIDGGEEFPISGDVIARRDSEEMYPRLRLSNVWKNVGVRPMQETYGIVAGSRIHTWRGTIEVTRVGTIAGFGMLDGEEVRWTASEVREVLP